MSARARRIQPRTFGGLSTINFKRSEISPEMNAQHDACDLEDQPVQGGPPEPNRRPALPGASRISDREGVRYWNIVSDLELP